MNEKDCLWEKVETKLDRIYEYQKQISTSTVDTEDKKKIYNKFGDAIVGLVKNLIDGKTEESKLAENNDFNQMFTCLNEKIDQTKSNKYYNDIKASSGKPIHH